MSRVDRPRRSASSRGHNWAWISPPRHFSAQAAMMPSGVPPMPSRRSTPVPSRAVMIAPATSPSERSRIRAPVSTDCFDQLLVAGPVEDDDSDAHWALALGLGYSSQVFAGGAVMSTTSAASGPVDDLVHVEHGRRVVHRTPFGHREDGDRVLIPLARQRRAVDRVDRDVDLGRCRRRYARRCKSIGASSFSPSPITTTPSIDTVERTMRIASTAAPSAPFLSPRPIQRPPASAAPR